nr:PREDICTED: complexin-4-like [Latimeria chalumnae]|eukprot:XP_014347302.1 PREDICTED: complexin-4-like [Latimeria chalumnae]
MPLEKLNQHNLAEEKRKRDAIYEQKKAERAVMRNQLREKYNLSKNAQDDRQVNSVAKKVQLPNDLAAITRREGQPEEENSFFGAFSGLQSLNLTDFTDTAQSTRESLRQTQCQIM